MKNHYQGGVFWFSGEDEKKMENSVAALALEFGTFVSNLFDVTLFQTLARISRIQKAWLLIIDDMDELRLSSNVRKLLSGSWQKNTIGHIIITTRRKPSTLIDDVQLKEITESSCLQLQCFDGDDTKTFLFNRTGIPRNEESETAAYRLFEELGGLPLALEQAAACIKSLGCSFSFYVEVYEAKRLVLLNEQSTNPVSEYYSEERLAVQTTWRLNIDYIMKNNDGKNATRFLNACLFFEPSEIQKDLINVGDPPVVDEQFRSFLGTSLGRYQIIKWLTDFSLFKQSRDGCLQVHRLMLEVIKEDLTPREQEESFIDAVRLLHHSFTKFYSPDQLLLSVADRETRSVDYSNPSLFYMWRALCIHAGEIEKNLKKILLSHRDRTGKKVFLPETARIIYHYALYLSAFCRHVETVEAIQFAHKILDWVPESDKELLSAQLNPLFLHVLPLPEFIRRHIQCCSRAPAFPSHDLGQSVDFSEFEKLREEGNRLFLHDHVEEAVKVYSSVIDRKEKPKLLDPRFFSNRASAYLRLQLYDKALEDANAYILQRPKCWKGYARKALALHGLNDVLGAELAAAQTYSLCKDVFSSYKLFHKFSYLQHSSIFCRSNSELLASLTSCIDSSKRFIFLYPGIYDITEDVVLLSCALVGCVDQCVDEGKDSKILINFKGHSNFFVFAECVLANIEFILDKGTGHLQPTSNTVLYNCSFSSGSAINPSLQALGESKVEKCVFQNSGAGGLLCATTGTSDIENCTFSNNGKAGLEVREGGTLLAREVYSYNNLQGLLIGPKATKCILTNSQINCNKAEGIFVCDCEHSNLEIRLTNNSIYHNGKYGISVRDSTAVIAKNHIFENTLWGIWLQSNSCCHISNNEISSNRLGGIRVGKRPSGWAPSVVEHNTIKDNGGPGLLQNLNDFDVNTLIGKQVFPASLVSIFPRVTIPPDLQATLVSANVRENVLQCNEKFKETQLNYSASAIVKFCSYCQEKGTLQKCTKCYTAEYCGRECQKKHWKKHKKMCNNLLKQSSILLPSTTSTAGLFGNTAAMSVNFHHHGLQEVGPNYSKPPEISKRFVVKVQQVYEPCAITSSSLCLYDRSLAINETFQSDLIQNLIRDLGTVCQRKYVEKNCLCGPNAPKTKLSVFSPTIFHLINIGNVLFTLTMNF